MMLLGCLGESMSLGSQMLLASGSRTVTHMLAVCGSPLSRLSVLDCPLPLWRPATSEAFFP